MQHSYTWWMYVIIGISYIIGLGLMFLPVYFTYALCKHFWIDEPKRKRLEEIERKGNEAFWKEARKKITPQKEQEIDDITTLPKEEML